MIVVGRFYASKDKDNYYVRQALSPSLPIGLPYRPGKKMQEWVRKELAQKFGLPGKRLYYCYSFVRDPHLSFPARAFQAYLRPVFFASSPARPSIPLVYVNDSPMNRLSLSFPILLCCLLIPAAYPLMAQSDPAPPNPTILRFLKNDIDELRSEIYRQEDKVTYNRRNARELDTLLQQTRAQLSRQQAVLDSALAVLARRDDFADGLAGTPLAAFLAGTRAGAYRLGPDRRRPGPSRPLLPRKAGCSWPLCSA